MAPYPPNDDPRMVELRRLANVREMVWDRELAECSALFSMISEVLAHQLESSKDQARLLRRFLGLVIENAYQTVKQGSGDDSSHQVLASGAIIGVVTQPPNGFVREAAITDQKRSIHKTTRKERGGDWLNPPRSGRRVNENDCHRALVRACEDSARSADVLRALSRHADIAPIVAEFRGGVESGFKADTRPEATELTRRPKARALVAIGRAAVALVVAVGLFVAVKGSDRSTAADHLQASLLTITDGTHTWKAVFPTNREASAQMFSQQEYQPDDPWEFLSHELDAGAYMLGGIIVRMELEGKADQEVTIYNVRPLHKREETPRGIAMLVTDAVGGSSVDMSFDLDAATPVAKLVLHNRTIGEDFFSLQRVGLRRGHKETFVMRFDTVRRAYSFDIEIQYEVDGKKYRKTVQHNGNPFRVTVDPCASLGPRAATDDAEYSFQRYSAIRYTFARPGDSRWRLVPGDPTKGCACCPPAE